jgi:hypothetical protein
MKPTDDYFIYATDMDGTVRYLATMLPHDTVFATGLPSEAILGEFTNGPEDLSPIAFQQNQLFIKFLSYVIGKHAKECPGLLAETRRQKDGFVYILDNRTPTPDGTVPPEDIIGAMEIANGQMIRYHGSLNYRLLTTDGFMQLEAWLKDRLIEELFIIANRTFETL